MKRKRAVRLGITLGLIIEVISIALSIPTASGPMFIHYSPEAMRNAVMPAGFPPDCSLPVDEEWMAKVDAIRWVAYGNPGAVPGQDSYQQKIDTILQDLTVLKKAGFSGLVTYGASGVMGKKFLSMAQALGYEGSSWAFGIPPAQTN